MFSPIVRYIASALVGSASCILAPGTPLFHAALVTGASTNYNVSVSWFSVLGSAVWPPSWQLFVLLLGVLLLASFTLLTFLCAPRGVGVAVLFLQAGIGFYCGGALGSFFLVREFEVYHFSINAEKPGEYWFVFEAAAIRSLTAIGLAVIRFFARKHSTGARTGQ
jgi:hypothetical protein